jgi:NAD(P)-dependent dehydrogenase (short-subunit alcohol dehydrogenase family)
MACRQHPLSNPNSARCDLYLRPTRLPTLFFEGEHLEEPMDYRDRHVIVTGGTGALGSAVVSSLVRVGAICHVPYIHRAEAERFTLRNDAKVKLIADVDLSDEAAVTKLYEAVPQLWASIHLAGGFAMNAVADTGKQDLMKQVEMNLTTAFLCCRAAVSSMLRDGRGGRIVNVASRPALEWRLGSGMAAYAASKAAVAALTVALGEEVVSRGILVNAVAPSTMDTETNRKAMPKADHAAWPKVEEVAAVILFLASPENRVTRSAVLPVYGRS